MPYFEDFFEDPKLNKSWKYEFVIRYGNRGYYRIYKKSYHFISEISKFVDQDIVMFKVKPNSNNEYEMNWHFSTAINSENEIIKSCIESIDKYEQTIPTFKDSIRSIDFDIKKNLQNFNMGVIKVGF